jgi:hypothetical protein
MTSPKPPPLPDQFSVVSAGAVGAPGGMGCADSVAGLIVERCRILVNSSTTSGDFTSDSATDQDRGGHGKNALVRRTYSA